MKFYKFPRKNAQDCAVQALDEAPLPDQGSYTWCVLPRSELPTKLAQLQELAAAYAPPGLLELHVKDLLNAESPSRYEYSSHYDLLILRQLASCQEECGCEPLTPLPPLCTTAVCFVVFDQLLISIYDDSAEWRDSFLARFMQRSRLPHSPAHLMLRIANDLVDEYQDLRKMLGMRLQHWQRQLLLPTTPFRAWKALLSERTFFHDLTGTCEEQHDAMQEWLDGLLEQNESQNPEENYQRDVLVARGRDIINHIQRVNQYVGKVEASIENAVQIHFSAQTNRAAAMQILTVIAAIFLPLNFVTGFFGMNFDNLPWIHLPWGVGLAVLSMVLAAGGMSWFFWRKRFWLHEEI